MQMANAKLAVVQNEQIKIEKGVPQPTYGKYKYPWADMDVGDSFLFPPSGMDRQSCYNIAGAASRRFAPKQFKASIKGGPARCWRIA
jgi:hypothetical protein